MLFIRNSRSALFLRDSWIYDPRIGSSRDFAGWAKRFYNIQIFLCNERSNSRINSGDIYSRFLLLNLYRLYKYYEKRRLYL